MTWWKYKQKNPEYGNYTKSWPIFFQQINGKGKIKQGKEDLKIERLKRYWDILTKCNYDLSSDSDSNKSKGKKRHFNAN